jgi:DNA-binding GntR family transcriptional regulator
MEYRASLSAQGEFRLPDVPPGTYTLKVENAHDDATQYVEYSQSLIVADSDITNLRIVLAAKTGP